jgi:DNA-binding NarL/FixJ family response regulator
MTQETTRKPAGLIRVFMVDDDLQIHTTLAKAMEDHPEFELVGQAFNLTEGLQGLAQCTPDVLLVDLGLPDGSGLQLIEYAQQQLPGCEIMVLTVFGDEASFISCIEAGATGYLTKDTHTHDILDRLKQLRAGGSPISPLIARRLLHRFRTGLASPPTNTRIKPENATFTALSEREQQVLEMVAKGFMQAEIAEIMGVSVNTVSTFIKRIYKKLSVNSRTSAVHRANALGLINLKDC